MTVKTCFILYLVAFCELLPGDLIHVFTDAFLEVFGGEDAYVV